MNLILLLIVFVFLLFFSLLNKYSSLSKVVILTYFLMVLCSIPLSFLIKKFNYINNINLGGFFFSICLLILLIPFCFSREKNVCEIYSVSFKVYKIIADIIIFLSICSVFYYLLAVIKLFNSPNLSNFRYEIQGHANPFLEQNIFNTICGVAATFYTIPIFLFYISISFYKSKCRSILLFISSFSYPLFVLSFFGRDGFLFWFVGYFSCYCLFSNFMSKKSKSFIKKIIILFSIVCFVGFLFITFVRFGGVGKSMLSIISYLGQQPSVFIKTFSLPISVGHLSFNFPLFSSGDYFKEFSNQFSVNDRYLSWSFGTLINGLYISFGAIKLVFILFFISIFVFATIFPIKKKVNVISYFCFFAYSQIIIQGVFYFRQYNRVGNLYLIILSLVLILSFIVKYKVKLIK